MHPADVVSTGDPTTPSRPDPTDAVYASSRTRVVRQQDPTRGRSIVVKQIRGTGAVDRLAHELEILHRVAGIEGTMQLESDVAVDGALLLHDYGTVSLAQTVMPMPISSAVGVAHELARTLDAVHRRGVTHCDVNPANIMIDAATGAPTLIDFGLATTAAFERPGFSHVTDVVGTLPYLAPEQTGRTGWAVDPRADLYGLGATLYELVTGEPPFGRGETLAMLHAHLSAAPQPPAERNAAVPGVLSDIILRLLQKEPDRRYQSAAGLAHDLGRLRTELAGDTVERFPLGERDYPLRLAPAGRPVGRDEEIELLSERLDAAARGDGGAVLVRGAPGVGKSTVTSALRPLVTGYDGWYVEGKFDQSRRDTAADGVYQALRALGRLLLAEPEAELKAWRETLRTALGPNAGVLVSVQPEFAVLLDDVEPAAAGAASADDDTEARLVRASVDLAVAVSTVGRPLVIVLDDLQWAGTTPIAFVDALVTDPRRHAVLLIGAYRDSEVDAVHPLTARLGQWERLGVSPPAISLANLAPAEVGTLLADMLRLDTDEAGRLAAAMAERTGGNPFDTVELVNALRRDDVLVLGGDGWEWDDAAIRRYVGQGDVIAVLAARIGHLPATTVDLLRVQASLGGELTLDLLAAAAGLTGATVAERLAPALEDGVLVFDRGGEPTVRFRHDRVSQAVSAMTEPGAQLDLHLELARRLAGHPELAAMAAEQYLAAVDAITDPDEQRRAAALLRAGAAGARLTSPGLAERFLAAATRLPATGPERAELREDWHQILCHLARFDAADGLYAEIERTSERLELSRAPRAHIRSLSVRNRQPEALMLGLELLGRLGLAVPSPESLFEEIGKGYGALRGWVAAGDVAGDLERPETDDPVVLAAAAITGEILPVAYFGGQPVFAWLVCEAQRMWAESGPCAALVPPLAHAGFMTIALDGDHRTGYEAVRRVLAVSDARGYEPQTSLARFLFSLGCGQWFEPVTDNVDQARRAREGLQFHGHPQVCYTYFSTLPQLADVAPSLEAFAAEAEAALATAARVGDEHSAAAYIGYRQLARALRGDTAAPGSLTDRSFDIDAHLATLAQNPTAAANINTVAAVAAAVFGDVPALIAHAGEAVPLLPFINATYLTMTTHLVQALAQAEVAQALRPDERTGALAELDTHRQWIALRAEDSPASYRYLVELVDAERLRAEGDTWAAAMRFDAALQAVAETGRPLHHALITERAARFHLNAGTAQIGRSLLADALRLYGDWGASGKVAALQREHPELEPAPAPAASGSQATTRSISLAGAEVDHLAVLRASRALSSMTSLDGLREQVADVLSAMTGADVIRLLQWDEDAAEGDDDRDDLPASVIRYVHRTRQPLLVDDATRDDRFARDLYLSRLESCSLLAMPILSRGRPLALLVLEKESSRGAFSTSGLETVSLVAGQLAVSLENAAMYASLENKVAQRTQELAAANSRLEMLSQTDPLTGLANRRRLEDVLDHEWDLATTIERPISVIMVDIDHFKAYNDHFGHQAGDTCLHRVATTLARHVRSTDVVARYGGEEFSIILPGADMDAARRVAESIRRAVAALRDPHPDSPEGYVTVSVGVASAVPSADDAAAQLVGRADQGLYEAKRGGRNRVATA